MIKILKIIDRATDKEREIYDTPFVRKPERYTYIKVKSASSLQPKTTAPAVTGTEIAVPVSEDDEQYDDIYVEAKNLSYEKDGQLVYETDDFVFIAKDMPRIQTNYLNFF